MNGKKTLVIAAALLVAASILVSACRPGTPTPAPATPVPTTAPPKPTSPPPAEGPVTVDVWFHSGRGGERDALTKIFSGWSDPNIKLNLVELPEGDYNQQVQAAAVAGQLPCLLDFDGPFVYNYVWGGYLIPLDDYFTKDELSDFLPSIIAQGTYRDGRLYSLGQFDSGLAIWARKSYLEAAGVRIPTVEKPWTGDEFNAALEALAALPQTEYAIDLKMNYAPSAPSEWLTYPPVAAGQCHLDGAFEGSGYRGGAAGRGGPNSLPATPHDSAQRCPVRRNGGTRPVPSLWEALSGRRG
jgi:multiple sugar transport system substrate-binding protein